MHSPCESSRSSATTLSRLPVAPNTLAATGSGRCCLTRQCALPFARPCDTPRTTRYRRQCAGTAQLTSKERAVAESLLALEWPALCRQVAAFCDVAGSAQGLLESGLRFGKSQEESAGLLEQTAEALQADLKFGNVSNIYGIVDAAEAGRTLPATHLNAVASTLETLTSLEGQLQLTPAQAQSTGSAIPSESCRFPSLAAVLGEAAGGVPAVHTAIRQCIGVESASVLDRASKDLAEIRRARRANVSELRAEGERWARQMFAQKASENAQVMDQRGRICVSVKSGRQGDLPKGSIRLGASRSGATLYIEPAPLVELNNTESRLAGQEAEAEAEVLMQLTQQVASSSDKLRKVMKAILELDTITARAKHAGWLSASRPEFVSQSGSQGSVHLPGARHPLLMQAALPPLPELPSEEEDVLDLGMGSARPFQQAAVAGAESKPQGPRTGSRLPRPVDLTVPPGKASVVLTGPNTGGKTASLKTLGLLVLMAKAGLFLPLDQEQGGGVCCLRWFDAVLADIGDSQDLGENLSTFSGHVHRLKRITAATTPQSVVLLDELGSGTDPVEGGALAGVLLEWLLDRAALTVCTSHHAELKELSVADERLTNASVEFDEASLQPTYRLLWGEAGQSQALAVARGLGLDRDIIQAAQDLLDNASIATKPGQHAGQLKGNLATEAETAMRRAELATKQRKNAETRKQELEKEAAQLKSVRGRQDESGAAELQHARETASSRAQEPLRLFAEGRLSFEEASAKLEEMKDAAAQQRSAAGELFGQSRASTEERLPRPGDAVRLLSMGGKVAKVLKPAKGGSKLAVQVGKLTVNVGADDVALVDGQDQTTSRSPPQKRDRTAAESGQSRSTGEQGSLMVQLPENTTDLRGMRQSEAVSTLEGAFDSCPEGSALFVIHGRGTGAVKAAIRRHLQQHPLIKRFYDEPSSAGGCTVVEFKHNG